MQLTKIMLGSTVGLFAVALSSTVAIAQQEVLEVRVGASSPVSSPSIRFIESREHEFKQAVNRNNVPVGTIFRDSQSTTNNALSYSDRLHGVGVGANSQVAVALCAIEGTEVASRQDDLEMVQFHLDRVVGLLAEVDPSNSAIANIVDSTWAQDRNALYQGMHASMETTNCVPNTVNARIDDSEAARLAIAQTARDNY